VQFVEQPAAADSANHRADIVSDHERQRRAQTVAERRHQLGQPGVQRVEHEQTGEVGHPEHHGAERGAILEHLADRCSLDLVLMRHQELLLRLQRIVGRDLPDHFPQFGVAVQLDQERQRLWYIFQDERDQHDRRAGAGQKSCLCGVNFEVRHDRRQRSAGNGDIVAVEHEDQIDPSNELVVKAVELGLVGQLVNVYLVHDVLP
jgi:hypothetical protein